MLNVSTETKTKAPPGTAHGHARQIHHADSNPSDSAQQPTNTLWVGAQRGRHLWSCVEFSFLPKSATVGPVQHLLTVTVINVFIYTLSGY